MAIRSSPISYSAETEARLTLLLEGKSRELGINLSRFHISVGFCRLNGIPFEWLSRGGDYYSLDSTEDLEFPE